MDEKLVNKLQQKMVDLTRAIDKNKADKKETVSAYNECIKDMEKNRCLIAEAIADKDEEVLICGIGEFYRDILGVK